MAAKKKPKKKTPRQLEKDIQKEILLWLDIGGYVHWRQNSGYAFVANRMIKLGMAGLPDIIVVLRPGGRVVGLEVKAPNGKLRPSQIEFANKLMSVGGEYVVVRSLAEAKEAIRQIEAGTHA
jgi:hypothetical protein